MLPEGIHRFAVADHPIFPSLDPDHECPLPGRSVRHPVELPRRTVRTITDSHGTER